MDSVPDKKTNLETINKFIVTDILASFEKSERVSLELFKEYLSINKDYNKSDPLVLAADFVVNNSGMLENQGKVLLLLRSQFGNKPGWKTLYSDFETRLLNEFKNYGASAREISKIRYWQTHFPDFKAFEAFVNSYYSRFIRIKIDENDFSYAQLLLGHAQKVFPADKNL